MIIGRIDSRRRIAIKTKNKLSNTFKIYITDNTFASSCSVSVQNAAVVGLTLEAVLR
jgi:hypothetical protein